MLPDSYKQALKALQDQANAAMLMTSDKAAGKAALVDAHRQMAKYDAECRKIVRLVMQGAEPGITIPDLTEERLGTMLGFSS